jgi:hypothetical protein
MVSFIWQFGSFTLDRDPKTKKKNVLENSQRWNFFCQDADLGKDSICTCIKESEADKSKD